MTLVLGRPPRALRSRPVNPGAKAPGMEKGTPATRKRTGTPGETGPDEVRRTTGATRHAREARRRPQPRHTDRCQATTAAGCRKPGQCAPQPHNHGRGATPQGRRGQAAPERPDALDSIVRGGPSSSNRRPPDWSIQGPVAVDAPRTGTTGAEQVAGATGSHRSGHEDEAEEMQLSRLEDQVGEKRRNQDEEKAKVTRRCKQVDEDGGMRWGSEGDEAEEKQRSSDEEEPGVMQSRGDQDAAVHKQPRADKDK